MQNLFCSPFQAFATTLFQENKPFMIKPVISLPANDPDDSFVGLSVILVVFIVPVAIFWKCRPFGIL